MYGDTGRSHMSCCASLDIVRASFDWSRHSSGAPSSTLSLMEPEIKQEKSRGTQQTTVHGLRGEHVQEKMLWRATPSMVGSSDFGDRFL